ncbi:MAG: 4-phosphoerythronate dehydrogenase [Paludibacteraceae bacterium]
MTKPRILIDDCIPFIRGVFERVADVRYLPAADFVPEAVAAADALIVRTRTHCNAALLADSSVKFVATATIGFDHIDVDFCRQRGIAWTNAAGCNAEAVAQYVASALCVWAQRSQCDLHTKTLGIVGVGHVGSAVARVAKLLGMNVLCNDPLRDEPDFVSLDEVAVGADVITFHTPLTYTGMFPTYHLADADFFSHCERKPLIINAARGGVVDEQALLTATNAGCIAAYVLDCWEGEPHIAADVLRSALIATPHIAGYSADGKANATTMAVQAVSRFFGLGLDDFVVGELPPKLLCRCTRAELPLRMLATYDIMADDARFRHAPTLFEQQRSCYPMRREVEWSLDCRN